jgi:hypothetical protein
MLAPWSDCLLQYAYVGKRVLFSLMLVGVMNLQLDLQILPHPKNSGVQQNGQWWFEYLTRLILCQLMWSQSDQACTIHSGSPRGHCLVQTLTANVWVSSFAISWFTWVFGSAQLANFLNHLKMFRTSIVQAFSTIFEEHQVCGWTSQFFWTCAGCM